jgi:ribonuclease VapC
MAVILDSSAVLAYFLNEPGWNVVEDAIAASAGISSANLAEVMSRLVMDGTDVGKAASTLIDLPMTVFDLDATLAIQAGAMFTSTRPFGLSLGNRICLALAARERLPALTADRIWAQAGPLVGVEVRLIR